MEKILHIGNERSHNLPVGRVQHFLDEGWKVKSVTPFTQNVYTSKGKVEGDYGVVVVIEKEE